MEGAERDTKKKSIHLHLIVGLKLKKKTNIRIYGYGSMTEYRNKAIDRHGHIIT